MAKEQEKLRGGLAAFSMAAEDAGRKTVLVEAAGAQASDPPRSIGRLAGSPRDLLPGKFNAVDASAKAPDSAQDDLALEELTDALRGMGMLGGAVLNRLARCFSLEATPAQLRALGALPCVGAVRESQRRDPLAEV